MQCSVNNSRDVSLWAVKLGRYTCVAFCHIVQTYESSSTNAHAQSTNYHLSCNKPTWSYIHVYLTLQNQSIYGSKFNGVTHL